MYRPITAVEKALFTFQSMGVRPNGHVKHDGYLEVFDLVNHTTEQVHFDLELQGGADETFFNMHRHSATGERQTSSQLGQRLYKLCTFLSLETMQQKPEYVLTGLVFFSRPRLGVQASQLRLFGRDMWRFSLDRSVYFQSFPDSYVQGPSLTLTA